MSSRPIVRLSVLAGFLLCALAACRSRSPVKLAIPTIRPGIGTELSETHLSMILVCNDSLGLDAAVRPDSRCIPCIPFGTISGSRSALQHARTMWAHVGRAPHDMSYVGASCASLAYDLAKQANPDDAQIDVEHALVRLASANDSIRALGLSRMDSTSAPAVRAPGR